MIALPSISRKNLVALIPSFGEETLSSYVLTAKPYLGKVKTTRLAMSVDKQKYNNWCWAAVGLAVRRAYGTAGHDEQCTVAGEVLNRKCCPYGVGCNEPQGLELALGKHCRHPAIDDPKHRNMTFVKEQIEAGHPIAVRIHRTIQGAGHAVVIAGYLECLGEDFLWVWDPERGHRQGWAFDQFLSNYHQDGYWHVSFLTHGGTVPKEVEK